MARCILYTRTGGACTLSHATPCPYLTASLGNAQISTLMSLGQVQTEEGYSDHAVDTYLQILSLQEDEEPDEVADAHVQVKRERVVALGVHVRRMTSDQC